MARTKQRKRRMQAVVTSHLSNVKRALLEGDKRLAFLEFLNETDDRRGLYALYDSKGRLYYAGKASDLPKRLEQHLKDKHADSWDRMSLFFLSKSANVSELEGLIVASAKPGGNRQKPRLGTDLRRTLRKSLKQDALGQIDAMIYPEKKQSDKLSGRITPKKLRKVTQTRLAAVLGITPARVNQLMSSDRKGLRDLRAYIKEGGHRDKVLLLLQQTKRK